jgi:hypothetical protein
MPALWQPFSSVWHPWRSASLPTQKRHPARIPSSQAGHKGRWASRTPRTQRLAGAAHGVSASAMSSNSNTVRHGQTAPAPCVPQGGMPPLVSDSRQYFQQNLQRSRPKSPCGQQIDRPLLCLGSLPFRRTLCRGCLTGQCVTAYLVAALWGLYTAWLLIARRHPESSRLKAARAEWLFWGGL